MNNGTEMLDTQIEITNIVNQIQKRFLCPNPKKDPLFTLQLINCSIWTIRGFYRGYWKCHSKGRNYEVPRGSDGWKIYLDTKRGAGKVES